VVLLVAFEDDVLGFRVRLERGVEDVFLDLLVSGQLDADFVQQRGARLDRALGGLFSFGEQLLDVLCDRLPAASTRSSAPLRCHFGASRAPDIPAEQSTSPS